MKHSKKDLEIIVALQENESRGMEMVYHHCYPKFLSKMHKRVPKASTQDIEDAFQEAIIVLILKFIRAGRIYSEEEEIIGLWIPLCQFIYVIGFRILIRSLPRPTLPEESIEIIEEPDIEEQIERLYEAFCKLCLPCKRLIFYRVGLNLDAKFIANILNQEKKDGENPLKAGAIRTRLYRCMKQLRKYYFELLSMSEQ